MRFYQPLNIGEDGVDFMALPFSQFRSLAEFLLTHCHVRPEQMQRCLTWMFRMSGQGFKSGSEIHQFVFEEGEVVLFSEYLHPNCYLPLTHWSHLNMEKLLDNREWYDNPEFPTVNLN